MLSWREAHHPFVFPLSLLALPARLLERTWRELKSASIPIARVSHRRTPRSVTTECRVRQVPGLELVP
eukprot:37841-Prorocentrum_minimum.AAC.2